MDLEGVLVPEVWISVAEKTGIEKLKLTTRDISDYDVLMKSLLERVMQLPDDTDVIPGHGQPTSIGREATSNPFLQPFNEEDTAWWEQDGIPIKG